MANLWTDIYSHKRSLLLCLVTFFCLANSAYAQDQSLRWNLSSISSVHGNGTIKSGIEATVFLNPLSSGGGPIAERYFLNPTDAIRWTGFFESVDLPLLGYQSSGVDTGVSYSRVFGKHLITPRLFYISNEGIDTLGTGVNYSYATHEGARAYVYSQLSNEEISTGSSFTGVLGTGFRKLWQFNSGKSLATDIQLEYTKTKNESRPVSILELQTSLDYYFNHRWSASIGLNLAESDVREKQSRGLDLSTEFYFTSQFSVGLEARIKDALPNSGFPLRNSGLFLGAKMFFK